MGLTIDWDYVHKKYTSLCQNMPLKHLNGCCIHIQQNHNPLQYGAKAQYAKAPEESPLLDSKGIKFLQAVACTFLYYGRAVDPTIIAAINALATEQAKPTERQWVD